MTSWESHNLCHLNSGTTRQGSRPFHTSKILYADRGYDSDSRSPELRQWGIKLGPREASQRVRQPDRKIPPGSISELTLSSFGSSPVCWMQKVWNWASKIPGSNSDDRANSQITAWIDIPRF
ncbi:hypothetical protein HDG42_007877 [Paraburkholderia sp. JPY171]|nr:hypothetical protein [Paraburkholderia atlantica]